MTNEEISKEKGGNETIYEVSYLLLPSLALEQVPAQILSLKEMIQKVGGAMISDEDAVLVDLAYPMTKVIQTDRHKYSSGYFGWFKFEMTADGIEAVKKNLDGNLNILRYLIIKTVRENTLLNGKMMLKKEELEKIEEDGEIEDVLPEETASLEVMDKSIDDLVIA